MDKNLVKATEIIAKELGFDFSGFVIDAAQSPVRGYRIAKKGNSVTIEYGAKTGYFSALLTLMARKDEDFEESRAMFNDKMGIMVDCARNGVLSVGALKLFIINAALCGYNYLQLYVEDCMRLDGEPYFGHQRGAYTKEELKETVEFGQLFGIEVMPCIQTLAHLNQIFRWDGYFEDIRDINDILLIGEEKTYALIEKMVKTVAECFATKRINIGMDEAHMVGLGKYLDKFGCTDRYQLVMNHLEKVIAICNKYGLYPEMWGDMFFRIVFKEYYAFGKKFDKSFIEKVPKGVKLFYWDYYHTRQEEYEEMIDLHRDLCPDCGFAGGLYTWIGFAPHNEFSLLSMIPAIKACKKKNIGDIMMTLWGDNGNECSRFAVLPSALYVAEMCYDENVNKDLLDKKMLALCGYTFDEMLALDNPNRMYEGVSDRPTNPAKYLLFTDPLIFYIGNYIFDNYGEYYKKYYPQLAALAKRKSRYSYLFDAMAKISKALINKATLPLGLRKAYKAGDKEAIRRFAKEVIPQCVEDIKAFYKAFKLQWYNENKRYGFEIQDIRLGGLLQRLQHVGEILNDYVEGKIAKIEELEEPFLDVYGKIDRENFKGWAFNHFDRIASSSVL